jgi:conjugal transfer ATP-binding protein TraC
MDDVATAVRPTLIARARDAVARVVDGWFVEEPPGAAFERGELPPTLAQQKRLTDSVRLSQFLPFESYDPAKRLYHNVDSLGFLLEAAPATGLDEARLNVLTGLVTQGIRNHTTIQISLYGDPDIHPLLDAWEQARQQVEGAQAAALRGLAKRRVEYLRGGAWKSLFSDQPLVVRNWRVFVSFLRPKLSGSEPDPGEMDYLTRTRESYKSTLQSAGLLAGEVEPQDLIRLFDGLLNPTDRPRGAFT